MFNLHFGFILKISLFFVYIFTFKISDGQKTFPFDSILNQKPIFKKVNSDIKKYRLQIIYTQITRDLKGNPSFKQYNFHVDSTNYFYCASLVKLPCSILALEKTKKLKIFSNTIMLTDSANACQHKVNIDTTSINGFPSVAQYIKRMALVSDNFAYSRIYEFLGVDDMHERLSELGYKNIRIVHRFDGGCKGTENTTTNPIGFCDNNLRGFIYLEPKTASKVYVHPLGKVLVGKAYINSDNKKVNQPKDFTNMNYMSLQNTHTILQRLVFSNYLPFDQRFDMMEDDRQFLINYLTMYPRESSHPTYNSKIYFDSYKKYFIYGDSKSPITNSDLKITNIVGQSYGFMTDCAYIHNEKDNVEFMLSAVIYTNEDQIINDGRYEYNTIALPFLAELGRQMYAYELKRKK